MLASLVRTPARRALVCTYRVTSYSTTVTIRTHALSNQPPETIVAGTKVHCLSDMYVVQRLTDLVWRSGNNER